MTAVKFRIFFSPPKLINQRVLVVFFVPILFSFFVFSDPLASTNNDFKHWINEFKKTALAHNISPSTFDLAFKTIDTIDPSVLKRAAHQPEFFDPAWNYFSKRIHKAAILEGQNQSQKWNKWLHVIEDRFGVDRNILLAIWSIESNYGATLGNKHVMRDVIRSLATLAYADPKRAKYAHTQLIAAMKILQSGKVRRSQLVGSWAGALGHTQFIPSSYLAYAVDIDEDGYHNIWTSVPDALATAANLLHVNGWRPRLRWGFEVKLPHGKQFPQNWLSFQEWRKLGVRHARGKPFPSPSEQAVLKLPDGSKGPAFLVTKNFFVIKRYNNADRYAFAVGLLSDQIANEPGLVHDWNRTP